MKCHRRTRSHPSSIAARFGLQIAIRDPPGFTARMKCAASRDTAGFLRINRTLWRRAWPEIRGRSIMMVGVHLDDVGLLRDRSGDLLAQVGPADRTRAEKVSRAADLINQRFGPGTLSYGISLPHPGFFERG